MYRSSLFQKLIFGSLIMGGVAEGKSTVLAHYVKSAKRRFPASKFLIVSPDQLMMGDNQDSFFKVSTGVPTPLDVQRNFLTALTELFENKREVNVVAIDEPAYFFKDQEIREEFVNLCLGNYAPIRLLMTTFSIASAESVFGHRFAHSFSEYTLLASKPQAFFMSAGIDQSVIKRNTFLRLKRDDLYLPIPKNGSMPLAGEFSQSQLHSFYPGKPEIEVTTSPTTFAEKISAMFGMRPIAQL